MAVTTSMVLAGSALADHTPEHKAQQAATEKRSTYLQSYKLNGAAKASDIIGMTVKNYQDKKLGKVEDLAVDVESGRIVQVILSVGGFAGVGDSLTAVPPGVLHYDASRKVVHLDATKEKLEGAPKFDATNWSEAYSSNRLHSVYSYYGEEPALVYINTNEVRRPIPGSSREGHGTWETDRLRIDAQYMIPAWRLAEVQKASKIIGAPVKNAQNEKVGKVENMLVDLSAGRVVALVISSGGYLGIADELSAVPPVALRNSSEQGIYQLDASKETLSSAPHFKSNQWPDFGQPNYAGGVYRAYNVDPYFTTDADNTQRNTRDRDNQTLTPTSQGNSQSDINITAQIRKEIIAQDSMSVNAKNVKIITVDGRVTLRGPVNTVEEKRLIGEIASRVVRSENIDNQLEVKAVTTNN